MPTLNWIGRKAVENHHQQVPFHLLKEVPELSVGDPGSGNLLADGHRPFLSRLHMSSRRRENPGGRIKKQQGLGFTG